MGAELDSRRINVRKNQLKLLEPCLNLLVREAVVTELRSNVGLDSPSTRFAYRLERKVPAESIRHGGFQRCWSRPLTDLTISGGDTCGWVLSRNSDTRGA